MLYSLAKVQSEINEYVTFPLCGLIERSNCEADINELDKHVLKDLKATYKAIEKDLKPYKKDIEKFYLISYGFYSFVFRAQNMFDYESREAYIIALKGLSDAEIRFHIIGVLIDNEEKQPYSDAFCKRISKVIDDDACMAHIEELPIDSHDKWQLMQMVMHPKKMLQAWLDLLESIETVYNKYRQKFEEDANVFGQGLVDKLNASEGQYFLEATGNMVKPELFEAGAIFSSWVSAGNITLVKSEAIPYMSFGYRIEDYFMEMKEMEDVALVESVTTLKNLGDKTRYLVLKSIAEGERSTKVIAKKLGVSSATISYHINHLTSNRLIVHEYMDGRLENVVNEGQINKICAVLKRDFLKGGDSSA